MLLLKVYPFFLVISGFWLHWVFTGRGVVIHCIREGLNYQMTKGYLRIFARTLHKQMLPLWLSWGSCRRNKIECRREEKRVLFSEVLSLATEKQIIVC